MWKNLTDISYLKALLAKAGIAPQHSAGQHFLVCAEVVEATLLALDGSLARVTELGAGVGTLTGVLLEAGYKVRAIERDAALGNLIKAGIPRRMTGRLELVIDDLRTAAWGGDDNYQLVGNIPYNLSGFIIRRLTQLTPAPERAVLLVQREVGERLTAPVGNLSLIGLAVQLWGKAETLLNVPASCFWPEPKVDSQLVLFYPTPEGGISREEREAVLKLAGQFFRARRKQMGGTLRRLFNWEEREVGEVLQQSDIKPSMRPQEIPIEAWLALSRVVYSKK